MLVFVDKNTKRVASECCLNVAYCSAGTHRKFGLSYNRTWLQDERMCEWGYKGQHSNAHFLSVSMAPTITKLVCMLLLLNVDGFHT